MKRYIGKRVYDGVVIGKIFLYEEHVSIENNPSEGKEKELNKFKNAREVSIKEYKQLIYKNNENSLENDIILNYISLLEDLDLIEMTEKYIKENGFSAQISIHKTCQYLKEMLSNLDNEYLRERANDVEEVCNKIINKLQNKEANIIIRPSIILSKNLTVSSFLQMDLDCILGLILENVSPNSHIAILARSLAIPCIVSLNEELRAKNDDIVILDCPNNCIITEPTVDVIKQYSQIIEERNNINKDLEQYKHKKIETIDHRKIKVYANISSSYEMDKVLENNADGIGLFRTEYIYLNSHSFPSEEEQFNHYKKCIYSMDGKTTIIRTMDIGADKQVSYFNLPKEKNPALGYRGVRLYKEYKNVFMTQLRALLRASIYGDLKIMIPMITNVDEIKFVLNYIDEVKEDLKKNEIPFNEAIKVGAMIETPAAAIICDEIAKLVDFLSIGTNDLSQYLLAIDRENYKVLDIYNPKHKSILRLIKHICATAKQNNIEVGICGELARNKELLGFYIKCGVTEISVSSSYILECKKNITNINTAEIKIEDFIN